MLKICKKRIHGNRETILHWPLKKCPRSLYFPLLTKSLLYGLSFTYTPEITELRFSARASEPLKRSMKSMKLRYFKFELKPSLEWCHARKLELSSPKSVRNLFWSLKFVILNKSQACNQEKRGNTYCLDIRNISNHFNVLKNRISFY